jgi:hypothetical protein
MAVARVLVVRLPCHKVFPTGPFYLISLIHRAAPALEQQFLDLALIDTPLQTRAIEAAISQFQPDLIAFSWRDLQIFSPQDMDGGLRDAFVFFYATSPFRRLGAAFRGLRDIFLYRSALQRSLRIVSRTCRRHATIPVAIGGTGIRIFGDRIQPLLPKRVRVFAESDLTGFFAMMGILPPSDPIEPALSLPFLEQSFPRWEDYRHEMIGVQTKQGCPHGCVYCLYGYLEGRNVRRRDPQCVVDEVRAYAERWDARRFWFADAQLLSGSSDRDHLNRILEGILAAGLRIQWSGYLRVHEVDEYLASLMVRSGLFDLEVSLNSGSQRIVDALNLGFSLEDAVGGLERLSQAGYAGRVLLNLSLNAPGETEQSLRETLEFVERLRGIFGAQRVVPVIFFLAIQPHTPLERTALAEGHLRAGYNPLSVAPLKILKLIYNPPPLGRLIGRACVEAFAGPEEDRGNRILSSLESQLGARGKHPALRTP